MTSKRQEQDKSKRGRRQVKVNAHSRKTSKTAGSAYSQDQQNPHNWTHLGTCDGFQVWTRQDAGRQDASKLYDVTYTMTPPQQANGFLNLFTALRIKKIAYAKVIIFCNEFATKTA